MMRTKIAVGLVFGLSLVTYCLTLCPDVYTEGAGELIGATYLLGTPHPTGYPFFVLLGRLVALILPLSSPAVEINFASALFAAAAAAMMTWLSLSRGIQPVAAVVAGLALAWGRVFWSQAVIAEVYGLFIAATLAAIAACLAAAGQSTPRRRLLAGYLCGVAATTHLQAILALPMAVFIALRPAWKRARQRGQTPIRVVIPFVLAGVAGLSLWLYLPLRSGRGSGFHWVDVSQAAGLWNHLSAVDYRSSFFSVPAVAMWRNAERFLQLWLHEWQIVGAVIALIGVVRLWRTDRELLAIVGSAIGLNLLLAINYHRDPAGIDVFFLLAIACGALLIGAGAHELIERWRLPATVGLVVFAGFLVLSHVPLVDRSSARLAGQYGRDLLGYLPPQAVLLAEGDDVAFVLDYLQRVEGQRPDVEIYNRQGRGSDLATQGTGLHRQRLRSVREADLWRQGRDLYVVVARRPPVEGLQFVPHGLVYRIQESGSAPASTPVIDPDERLVSAGVDGDLRDPWLAKLAANYWWMAGEGYRAQNDIPAALTAYRRAAQIAPRSQSTLYNVSLMLFRNNEIDEAYDVIGQSISVDPMRPGPYRLAAQILRRIGDEESLGELHKRARFWGVFP
jgi:tetratricopeptide (TPR) repeat protein